MMKKSLFVIFLLLLVVFISVSCEKNCGCTDDTTVNEDKNPMLENILNNYNLTEADLNCIRNTDTVFKAELGGFVGNRVLQNEKNWLLVAVKNNPYIIEAIKNRNNGQKYKIETWYGEFPGAFLYGAAYCYKLTRSDELFSETERLIDALEQLQDDGYLGTYPDSEKFDAKYWDVGAHFFMMQGLLEWYDATGSERALAMAEKICQAVHRFRCIRQNEINCGQLMIISPVSRLYNIKNGKETLQLVNNLNKLENSMCNFYQGGLDKIDYYKLPVHRWENLFDLQGLHYLAETYNDETYVKSMLNHWHSLVSTDRHITGGMTTDETAVGSKFQRGSIETCASILWEDFSSTCYRDSKDSYIADELELTYYNAILGAQMPDGSMWTYDTPRSGTRVKASDELSWQATPESRDFNCCTANSARGIGLLSQWMTLRDEDTLYINYYGSGKTVLSTPSGNIAIINQDTAYPKSGTVNITLELEKTEIFSLKLRIPFWADGSYVSVNGGDTVTVKAGEYAELRREWKNGDKICLEIKMTVHFMNGQGEYKDYCAVYYGPILMAMDTNVNIGWNKYAVTLDAENFNYSLASKKDTLVAMKVTTADGKTVGLTDFASAGNNGAYYSSLFKVNGREKLKGNIDWGLTAR